MENIKDTVLGIVTNGWFLFGAFILIVALGFAFFINESEDRGGSDFM